MPERSGSPWPWRPGGCAEAPPKPCLSRAGHTHLCPRAQGDMGSSNGPQPHTDLHSPQTALPLYKAPWQQKAYDNTRLSVLYLNISKHLAKTFIFSLPQGEKVIRENGTNIPICQKPGGSALKGKFYHFTEHNRSTTRTRGPAFLFLYPICLLQHKFRDLISEEMAQGQSLASILPRIAPRWP